MDKVLRYLKTNQQDILEDLAHVVGWESPSHDKDRVDHCGKGLQALFQKHLGLKAEVIPQTETGNHLRFSYGSGDPQVLILTHFDTVWDVGRLSYQVKGNQAYGPGILDMKGGIVQALWGIKACRELELPLDKKIVFLCTSDEEMGSGTSRSLIEEEASKSEAVLIPEPSVAHTWALKTSRKGNGIFKMRIKGKASHSGNHHAEGISAVEEMAHQILFLHSLTDYTLGTTINAASHMAATVSMWWPNRRKSTSTSGSASWRKQSVFQNGSSKRNPTSMGFRSRWKARSTGLQWCEPPRRNSCLAWLPIVGRSWASI